MTAAQYRVLKDTTLHWTGDIIWLEPEHVQDHHEPVTTPPPVTRSDGHKDRPPHISRINDWPGSDASGEGTARWHPSGTQDPRLNEYGVLDDGAASAEDHAAETEPASDAAEPAVETQADAPDGDVTAPAERDGAK